MPVKENKSMATKEKEKKRKLSYVHTIIQVSSPQEARCAAGLLFS